MGDLLDGADLATIVTAHPGVDHEAVVEAVPVTVDLRGTTRHVGNPAALQL
jgi:UDP-N-acetyl-D-glucosamine dehydrogenase